jgi:hypothetical protein
MNTHDEAVKAAAEAMQRYTYEKVARRPATFHGYAEAAVAAAAPILLAEAEAEIKKLKLRWERHSCSPRDVLDMD